MSYIYLPNVADERGQLTFVEGLNHIPFEIKRIFYIYSVPQDSRRGGHAHKKCQQLIIPVSGKFCVTLHTPTNSTRYLLEDPKTALLINPLTWAELSDFEQGSVCLVLASELYDESDYIRDFKKYIDLYMEQLYYENSVF